MRFVTFDKNGSLAPGVSAGNRIMDISRAWTSTSVPAPASMQDLIENQERMLPVIGQLLESTPLDSPAFLAESGLVLGPAVPKPGKILCIGLNYRQHAIEAGMEIPAEPVLFNKFGNTIAASGQVIDISGLNKVDYECELAVVMGATARNVSVENALATVFAYCNANDLSDRDLQFRSSQWLLGKTVDHFCPVGPYLVTRDEVPDPQNLDIRGWLNGELRQDSHTSDMIFSVAEIISYVSSYFTLDAGDIILTGTPFGVILGMKEQQWMQAGDEYVVEIGDLGRLVNRMVVSDPDW